MNIIKKEWIFLSYFIPLFAVKLLDITSDNMILKIIGVLCLGLLAFNITGIKYRIQSFRLFCVLIFFSIILVFTSGKQGIFFSVIMLFTMQGMQQNKRIYKVCFWVGLIFLIIACINGREGTEVSRFMNGEWNAMVKRSNLLYVSYVAIVSLYLFIREKQLRNSELVMIGVISYCMYLYVGSRTGLGAVIFLLILIFLLRGLRFDQFRIIKYGCALFPLICFLFCLFSGINYGKESFWDILNMMLQGRVEQNSAYLDRYDITLFGQHIYESTDVNDFWVLDCAYLDMLICSGLLFSFLWIVFNFIVIKSMYEQKRMIVVSILLMYAVYGITETFLPNCFLNMSFFIYGQYIDSYFYNREIEKLSV